MEVLSDDYERDFRRIDGLGAVVNSNIIKGVAYEAAAGGQFSKAEQHGLRALPLLVISAASEFGGFIITCASLSTLSAEPNVAIVGAGIGAIAIVLGSIPFFKSLKHLSAAGGRSLEGTRLMNDAEVFTRRAEKYQAEADSLNPYTRV